MTLPTMLFLMQFWSSVYGLNPKIAMAVAETESKFNINATGLAGEVGLFQLNPPDRLRAGHARRKRRERRSGAGRAV